MAEAIAVGMKGATAAEKKKKEKFDNLEKLRILAACGLHKGAWDRVPPVCGKITKSGRTCLAVREAIELECWNTAVVSEF
jgi:hypothetical protein